MGRPCAAASRTFRGMPALNRVARRRCVRLVVDIPQIGHLPEDPGGGTIGPCGQGIGAPHACQRERGTSELAVQAGDDLFQKPASRVSVGTLRIMDRPHEQQAVAVDEGLIARLRLDGVRQDMDPLESKPLKVLRFRGTDGDHAEATFGQLHLFRDPLLQHRGSQRRALQLMLPGFAQAEQGLGVVNNVDGLRQLGVLLKQLAHGAHAGGTADDEQVVVVAALAEKLAQASDFVAQHHLDVARQLLVDGGPLLVAGVQRIERNLMSHAAQLVQQAIGPRIAGPQGIQVESARRSTGSACGCSTPFARR